MCHMQYIRLKTISHKLETAVRTSATKGESKGNSRHDLDPSSNLGIPSSGSTLRVYEIWQVRQELSSEGLRISQYMALAELFDSCRPQFSQLLNWDNDIYPMASPRECQGGDHPCINCFANNLERRDSKKYSFRLRCLSTVVPLCLRAGTRAASHTWRSPRGSPRSSRRHSLLWISCTWCSPEASSG